MVDLFEIQYILFELLIPRGLVEIWNRDGRRIKYFPPYSFNWVGLFLHYIKFPSRWSGIQSQTLEFLLYLSLMKLAFTLTVAYYIFETNSNLRSLSQRKNHNPNHHRSAIYVHRHFKQLKCYDGLLESSFMFMMQVYLTHFRIVALNNLELFEPTAIYL